MSVNVFNSIAERVGVSPRTVQRVLNGTTRDRRPTIVQRAEQIRAMARELNYVPNAAAKATATGRFHNIALVLGTDSHRSSLPERLLRGLSERLNTMDMSMSLLQLTDDQLCDPDRMPRLLREVAADGMLIDYTHGAPAGMEAVIRRNRIAAVWINVKRDTDCVRPNDFAAAYDLTRRLLSGGHRRIAFLDVSYGPAMPNPHYSVADRADGYRSAMDDAGLSPVTFLPPDGEKVDGPDRVRFCRAILERPDRPTAVVCYGESGLIAMTVAAAHLGLVVPRELSLTTFFEHQPYIDGALVAGMLMPSEDVGRVGLETLLEKMSHPSAELEARLVRALYLEGGSIVPPPRA